VFGPPIPRYGLTETIAAKWWARFKEWPPSYKEMLRKLKLPVPPHVFTMAAKFERERFWVIKDTEGGRYQWWEVEENQDLKEPPAPKPPSAEKAKAKSGKSDEKRAAYEKWKAELAAEGAALLAARKGASEK
jgi:hypothetical protein